MVEKIREEGEKYGENKFYYPFLSPYEFLELGLAEKLKGISAFL